jgi:hypothetical protein
MDREKKIKQLAENGNRVDIDDMFTPQYYPYADNSYLPEGDTNALLCSAGLTIVRTKDYRICNIGQVMYRCSWLELGGVPTSTVCDREELPQLLISIAWSMAHYRQVSEKAYLEELENARI